MMNTNDLRNLRITDRDLFVTLSAFAKEANRKAAHKKWSEMLTGFAMGYASAYKMLRHMKIGVYHNLSIGALERVCLDYWKDQRKVSMLYGDQRIRAEKKLARQAKLAKLAK
jgi:hypothetical protein